ncbi:hypothetical protein RRG08_047936 [Elysia crispata]|uniref:Uncharacterized protein n=1 Tax=Elysia crispata TaxID=231223 RepID=A0AAE0ZLZ8_9GAST|nr:hypothetical protein RRG08_047936 [Elysia crispata]
MLELSPETICLPTGGAHKLNAMEKMSVESISLLSRHTALSCSLGAQHAYLQTRKSSKVLSEIYSSRALVYKSTRADCFSLWRLSSEGSPGVN